MAGKYSVDAVFRAIDKFSRPIQRMERRSKRFTRSLGRAVSGVGSMAKGAIGALSRVKVHAAIAAGAIGLLAKNVIDTGMEYEQAITDVGAVMLKTRDQIKPLDDMARKLGATTKFTAAQAASGMELLAKAGFDTQQTMSAIPGILSAAAASGDDLATTVDNVVGVLKGMRLPAEQAINVADVLTMASTKTNSTIGSLAESMKNVSSVASQLKIPMKDAVAAVALLQDVGLDASVAGSATATMLTKLSALTPKTTAKLKKMGVAFQDNNGNALSLAEILGNLAKAAEKSGGNMQQVALFADLVGLRGQKAALNLQDMGKKGKFTDLLAELEKSSGAAEKMADIKLTTLRGQVTLLTSALDGLKVKLFDMEGGPLRDMVKSTTEWIGANQDLIASLGTDLMDAVKPLGRIFTMLADKASGIDVGDLISQLDQFVGIFTDSFIETFEGVLGGLDTMSELMGKLGMHGGTNDIMGELAENLGIIAAATAGAIIVFGKLITVVAAVASAIMGGLKSAFGAVVNDIGALVAAFVMTFDNIKAIFDSEKLTLSEKIVGIAKAVIRGFVDAIKAGASLVWDTATGFGSNFLKGVKHAFDQKSPSRKMATIARMNIQGYTDELDRSRAKVKAALRRITELPELPPANVQAPIIHSPPRLRVVRTGYDDRDDSESTGSGADGGASGGGPEFRPAPNIGAAAVARSVQETLSRETVTLRVVGDTKQVSLDNKPQSGRVTIDLPKSGTFD